MTSGGRERVERVVASGWFLAAVLLLAAGLRLAHVLALRRLPLFDTLIIDSWRYDEWAQRIAAGDWLGGDRAFYMDPLYPYFLAVLYRLLGRDLLLVRLVQCALGAGTCALTAVIGRRVGGALAGNLAALFMALYRPAIFHEGEIEKTGLGVFLAAATLALATGSSNRARLLAGVALGLAALTRGNLLLFAPVVALLYLRKPAAPHGLAGEEDAPRRGSWLGSPALDSAAAFALGVVLALAPVAWRNHRVSGEWILTTTQAGANFYTGNNPANPWGGFVPVPFVRPHPMYEEQDFQAAAERRAGRRLSASEASALWFREAWAHVRASPRFALRTTLRKVVLLLSDVELADGWDMYFLARYSPVLRLPFLGLGILLPFGLLGAWAGFRSSSAVPLLVAYAAVYSAGVVAFFVFSRYRVHLAPALAALAAAGVTQGVARLRVLPPARSLPLVLLLLAASVFSFAGVDLIGLPRDAAQPFVDLAAVYHERGDTAAAERLVLEALAEHPGSATALCGAGRLRHAQGRLPEAVDLLTRCVEANRRNPQGWYSLGEALLASGDRAGAARAFRTQLEIVPGHQEALARVAELAAR